MRQSSTRPVCEDCGRRPAVCEEPEFTDASLVPVRWVPLCDPCLIRRTRKREGDC